MSTLKTAKAYYQHLAHRMRTNPLVLFESDETVHRAICYLAWVAPHRRTNQQVERAIGLRDRRKCGAILSLLRRRGVLERLHHRYRLAPALLEQGGAA